MTPEEAYEKALRRIREAEKTGALKLDLTGMDSEWKLTGLETLTRLPPELERLTSLQSLNLSACRQLRNLSPLAGLASLQELDLRSCGQLSGDLSPLAGLTSLRSLDLSWCEQLSGDLSPLAGLTSLRSLDLSWCKQLGGDLSPLAGLTSLQSLFLNECEQLSGDLSPLAGLTSLRSLDLSECRQLCGDLSPLPHLTSLHSLSLSGCWKFGDLNPLTSLTSLQDLNLSKCRQLRDLSPLAGLTSLQSLNLALCEQLSGDLSPLASLSSLQTLNLFRCEQLSDLSLLAGLTSLQKLYLNDCLGVRRFAPLESLLPTLKELRLFGCKLEDLPPEVCGKEWGQNVLDKVRAHYEDLKSGPRIDAEVKVLFLGNGGVGKTQLCRRLRGETFDEKNVFSTHGIQLTDMPLSLEGFPEPVRLNFWDFGGQEIYYGSHSLFLQGQAVFLILWTPAHEAGTDSEGDLTFRRRPLAYWLDYLRAFAGTDAFVLIVQSQCDSACDRASHPPVKVNDFFFLRWLEVSAKTGLGLNLVKAAIEESVRDRFERRPPPPIGVGRVAVRDRLRQMLEEDQKREPAKRQHRLLERTEFDGLCDDVGGISDKDALLDFLHHNGVILYRPGLFGGRIILDQNWAMEAIYSIFHRYKCFKQLKKLHGRFSREDLELLIWSSYTPEEQKVFLGMMESCGICFKLRKLSDDEWEYIAPELLPTWSDAQEQLLGRLRDDAPDAEATARYAFLHEGILRGYLSKLGEHAKDAAIYWKYGCWFYRAEDTQPGIDREQVG